MYHSDAKSTDTLTLHLNHAQESYNRSVVPFLAITFVQINFGVTATISYMFMFKNSNFMIIISL